MVDVRVGEDDPPDVSRRGTEDRLDALAKILDEASRTGKIIALRLDRCIARGLVCSASEVLDKDPSDHHPMVLDMKVDAREEGALFAG